MNIPKFKPTKWKLYHCLECKRIDSDKAHYCSNSKHNIAEIDNVPFFVSDMEIKHFWGKWSELKSDKMGRTFSLSSSKLEKVIFGCGIQAGGKISNQWWMYAKVGGSLTVSWVKNDNK